jgi:cytochrome c biogenesis protein CcmG, thiol:disulfide interchange protein DsbE
MSQTSAEPKARRPWLTALPLIAVVAIAVLFLFRLFAGDPAHIPSALIGKPAPALNLPGYAGGPGLSDADLHGGHVTIVNVFGSWCEPCRGEQPLLMALSADPTMKQLGVQILGVAQKDKPDAIKKYFDELGDPYTKIGLDDSGRAGIDWGVYGVPETFIVDGSGKIAFKHIGPLAEDDIAKEIIPAVTAAAKAKS